VNTYHVPLFPKRFLVGEGGEQVTELSEVGSETWTHTNIFAGSRLTATYDGGGLHYEMADPLGTKRVQANISGQIQQTWTSLPFGNDLGDPECPSGGLGATEQFFTQKERDCESGNDYFFARYYTSAMGRFTTPDWSAKVEPVPYAKLDDPQSLDLYAYVRNNPVASDDPNGHGCNGWCDLHGNSNQSYSDIINQDEAQIARHAAFLGNTLVNVTTAQQQNSDKNTDVMLMSGHATPQPSKTNNLGEAEIEWNIVPQANNISELTQKNMDAAAAQNSNASVLLDESMKGGAYHWEGSHKGGGLDAFDPAALPVNQKWYINSSGGNDSSNKRIQVVIGMKPDGTLIKAWTVHVEWGRNGPVYSKID